MRTKKGCGREIERRVRDFLVRRGLEPVAENWHRRVGEIDLVMREPAEAGRHGAAGEDTIVFVEVRYRRHRSLGGGLESVDAAKRARLRRVARAWLQRHGDVERAARIDVIAVAPQARRGAGEPGAGQARTDAGADPDETGTVGDGPLDAGIVATLGDDAEGRPLVLEWVVNAVEDDA